MKNKKTENDSNANGLLYGSQVAAVAVGGGPGMLPLLGPCQRFSASNMGSCTLPWLLDLVK